MRTRRNPHFAEWMVGALPRRAASEQEMKKKSDISEGALKSAKSTKLWKIKVREFFIYFLSSSDDEDVLLAGDCASGEAQRTCVLKCHPQNV